MVYIKKYKKPKKIRTSERKSINKALQITQEQTGLSERFIKELLKDYTHSEIRGSKIADGEITITNKIMLWRLKTGVYY